MKPLIAILLVPLASCTQLSPEHGREKIFTIGIGVVDRVTTTRETPAPQVITLPSPATYAK